MSQNPENIRELAKRYGGKLAQLGTDLGDIQFSYKIEGRVTREYWNQRMADFKKYTGKGMEYYEQIHAMMNLVDPQEAQMFLLRISKFQELSRTLSDTMEKIRENPTIMDSKDRQQSLWSKEIKNEIISHSNKCLRHEMDMNTLFRGFYERHLKGILE